MKLGWKLITLWLASLTLFAGTGVVALVAPEALRGTFGLALRLLLGYCGIIVVGQVLAIMAAIRRRREGASPVPRPSAAPVTEP